MEYTLASQQFVDGVEQHERHPQTFEIPTVEEKEAITVGNFVKVSFISNDQEIPNERMWLKIIEVDHPFYKGKLVNYPICVDYRYGDEFQIHSDHILSIETRGII